MIRVCSTGGLTALLLAVSAGMSGCGPIQSTSFLLDAEVQIQAARTAEAEKYAPYEWTSANLYYDKAREEVAYSDYEAAVTYARKASSFAHQARENAMSSPKRDEAAPPPPVSETP